jgi:bacteriocin-like protein
MDKFKELSFEEMQKVEGGGWITQTNKIVKTFVEILGVGEALDEFTDGFSDGYNSVEPWKP